MRHSLATPLNIKTILQLDSPFQQHQAPTGSPSLHIPLSHATFVCRAVGIKKPAHPLTASLSSTTNRVVQEQLRTTTPTPLRPILIVEPEVDGQVETRVPNASNLLKDPTFSRE